MRRQRLIFSLLILAIVVVYLASCGGPPKPKEEPPAPSEPVATVFEPKPEPEPVPQEEPQRKLPQRTGGVYELVWVEPRVVAADTMMMLIAADRIDSVEIRPSERSSYQTPSISFRVTSTNCPARVNLLDGRGTLMMHLFNSELSPGYYKLSLSTSSRNSRLAAGSYFLKAEYCGQSKRVAVKLD